MQNQGDNNNRNFLVVTNCIIISLVSLEAAHPAREEKKSFFELWGEFTQAIKTYSTTRDAKHHTLFTASTAVTKKAFSHDNR